MIKVTKRHHTAALKFANEVRAKIGKRPVKRLKKGVRSHAYCCVIAETIGRSPEGKFGIAEIVVNGELRGADAEQTGGIKVKTRSKLVGQFIQAFDRGEIPELVR